MNGLTGTELQELRKIRLQATKFYASRDEQDLIQAKRMAEKWVRANRSRRDLRMAATRSIKLL